MKEEKDALEKSRDRTMVANNAQTIYDHLRNLENEAVKYRKRWLWELLQNAMDVAGDRNLKVWIEWTGNELLFRHNGERFSSDNISHLIYHGSSKPEENIGRYGTGFMTTHLISRQVQVQGTLSDHRGFSFELSRIASSKEGMAIALDQSWNNFRQSLEQTASDEYTTFIYKNVATEGQQTIETVLKDIPDLLPQVMCFSSAIEWLQISNRGEVITFQKESVGLPDIVTISESAKPEPHRYLVKEIEENKAKLLLQLDSNNAFLQKQSSTPSLFLFFPLIGTEDHIDLPFILHSEFFQPGSERDRLYLGGEGMTDTAQSRQNKAILEKAWATYIQWCRELSTCGKYGSLYFLLGSGKWPEAEWIDPTWAMEQYVKQYVSLDQIALVTSITSEECIPFSEARISWSGDEPQREDIWAFGENFYSDVLPIKEQREFLYYFRKRRIETNKEKCPNNRLTFQDMCKYVQGEYNSLEDVGEGDKESGLSRLKDLVNFLEKYEYHSYWSDYALLPNQDGNLKKAVKGELKYDATPIDKELKNISESLGKPIRSELLHEDIYIKSEDHQLLQFTEDDLLRDLLSKTRSVNLEEIKGSFTEDSRDFMGWLIAHDKLNELEGFPVRTQSERSGQWAKLSTDRELPFLAPVNLWEVLSQPYADLFPPDQILNEDYALILEDEIILNKLIEGKYLTSSILFDTEQELYKEQLSSMLPKMNELNELNSLGEDDSATATLSCQEITYFNHPKDKGVKDRIRKSEKRTRLFLKFLLDYLLAQPNALRPESVNVNLRRSEQSSEKKEFHVIPAGWLYPLKAINWVNIPKADHGLPLTANSLQPYFSEGSDLLDKLKRSEVYDFFHLMDISLSELVRNAVYTDEGSKKAWDQSYARILMNKNLNPVEVSEMLEDSEFINSYKQQRADTKRVQHNQEIGKKVEEALKEAFESEAVKQKGLAIKRHHWGMDYKLFEEEPTPEETDDCLISDETGQPEALHINSPLGMRCALEVKSARSQEVKVTLRQGRTACLDEYRKLYYLCVVPVDSICEISSKYVIDKAKFVPDLPKYLEDKVNNINQLGTLQTKVDSNDTTDRVVRTLVEGTQIRFVFSEKIWTGATAISFHEFIGQMVSNKGRSPHEEDFS